MKGCSHVNSVRKSGNCHLAISDNGVLEQETCTIGKIWGIPFHVIW